MALCRQYDSTKGRIGRPTAIAGLFAFVNSRDATVVSREQLCVNWACGSGLSIADVLTWSSDASRREDGLGNH